VSQGCARQKRALELAALGLGSPRGPVQQRVRRQPSEIP
jgi:hypothetical protein